MKNLKKILPFVIGFILLASVSFAQGGQPKTGEITDQDLKNFAATTQEAKTIQQDSQKKLQKLLDEEGMDFQRFQMIMISRQNPQMADSMKVTKEEEKIVQKIQPELTKINQKATQKFMAVIKGHGLTQQRFQQILRAVQTDPAIAQRFQKIQAEAMGIEQQ